ncbi:hypothetical protein VTO42DRAFT_941 [Malbranchea cinnamomea]
MAPLSEEDIEWFKSTFHPIPKPQLPEDCIEYRVYWISPKSEVSNEPDSTRVALSAVQKAASALVKDFLKDYIWQRDSFKLELTKEDGFYLLRGRTEYGDSIEDEWVIVYLLRELTVKYPNLWVKVTDSDGEFLLVEAAGTLPAWLEPNIADNRVWIHKGLLRIIKPESLRQSKRKITEKLTFRDARKIILTDEKRLMHSQSIEDEAFYRLRNYPQQISDNLHSALVTIPRKIAYLLHRKPSYVSPAVEAFYLRDPISLRPLRSKDTSKLTFLPDDLVTVSVKFTKVGYAQLKSQDFDPPALWKEKLPRERPSKAYDRAETGMKLACGFEMLLSDTQHQDKPAVREMKLVLEDIATGDEILPTDEEIEENYSKRDDDESWLNISFEDLEGELKGRRQHEKGVKIGDFGDKSAQENLQRIVAQFEAFLNDNTAALDGDELINEFDSEDDDLGASELSSDGEDRDASFDDEEFSKMMKEMMGMPSSSDAASSSKVKTGQVHDIKSSDTEEDDDSEKIEEISRQIEAELKEAGILDEIRGSGKVPKAKGRMIKGKGKAPAEEDQGNNEDADPTDADENININVARNLLESLRSQQGAAGPGSNLLGMMGMKPDRYDRE